MSRSAFAARFKELLGQTPLEYVTEWRMQKAMQLLEQRDKKLVDVARSVGYETDAAAAIWWARRSFSSWCMVQPGDCSPSRRVVSKKMMWFGLGIEFDPRSGRNHNVGF